MLYIPLPDSLVRWIDFGWGVAFIAISLQSGPIRGPDRTPWPNQRFMRLALRVLGIGMILASIINWGPATGTAGIQQNTEEKRVR
jgi:hypothetical protein